MSISYNAGWINNFNLIQYLLVFCCILSAASHRFGSTNPIIIARQGCFAPNEREREQSDTVLGSDPSRLPTPRYSCRVDQGNSFSSRLIHEADRPDLGVSPFGRRPEVNRDTVPSDVPSGAFLPLCPRNASHTIFRAASPANPLAVAVNRPVITTTNSTTRRVFIEFQEDRILKFWLLEDTRSRHSFRSVLLLLFSTDLLPELFQTRQEEKETLIQSETARRSVFSRIFKHPRAEPILAHKRVVVPCEELSNGNRLSLYCRSSPWALRFALFRETAQMRGTWHRSGCNPVRQVRYEMRSFDTKAKSVPRGISTITTPLSKFFCHLRNRISVLGIFLCLPKNPLLKSHVWFRSILNSRDRFLSVHLPRAKRQE